MFKMLVQFPFFFFICSINESHVLNVFQNKPKCVHAKIRCQIWYFQK